MLTILLILYLTRQKYIASARGTSPVRVHCVSCGTRYRYRLERAAIRTIHAAMLTSMSDHERERADDRVERELEDKLRNEFDCVPCPKCGDYQPEMVDRLKHQKYDWLRTLVWVPSLIGGLGFVVASTTCMIELMNYEHQTPNNFKIGMITLGVSGAVTFIGLAIAIGMWILHPKRVDAYDPNDPNHLEERLDEARIYARVIEPPKPKPKPPVLKPMDPIW